MLVEYPKPKSEEFIYHAEEDDNFDDYISASIELLPYEPELEPKPLRLEPNIPMNEVNIISTKNLQPEVETHTSIITPHH